MNYGKLYFSGHATIQMFKRNILAKILRQKINDMECVICRNGSTSQGKVTVTLEREGSIIAIQEVPAQICNNCGEYYLDAEMTKEVLSRAEQAIQKGVEFEVIKMNKVA